MTFRPKHWTARLVDWVLGTIIGFVVVVMILLAFLFVAVHTARAQDISNYPSCHGFIEFKCCCTRNGCFEIPNDAAEFVGDDHWRIKATGEIVKRTGWSKNGKTYRCANERDENGFYTRVGDPTATTKCFWPVPAEAGV
jgi:hypothetical protein